MTYDPGSLTTEDLNFLACLADDLAFVQVPLPPGDEEERECSECGSCIVLVIYEGEPYCIRCALAYVDDAPVLHARREGFAAGPSTLPTYRREKHNAMRRSA